MFKVLKNFVSLENRIAAQQCISITSTNLRCAPTETPRISKAIPKYGIPNVVVGQPTYFTHPHLIPEGELTYNITQTEYKNRRTVLVEKLTSENQHTKSDHIIVIPGACKQYMSDKIPYVFRQNSDFFYLTGCLEPGATLVMMKPKDSEDYRSIMFVHEKESHAELWEGPRTGTKNAKYLFMVDDAQPIESLHQFLQKTLSTKKLSTLWYTNTASTNPDLKTTIKSILKCANSSLMLSDPQKTLHSMRVIKSPAEIELMKDTCLIGAKAMNMAISCSKPGLTEHEISAILEFSCRAGGAEHLAFPPVVAGGARATHIHYVANNQLLNKDDLVLVDSGCQRWLYNSDISRTWPMSGKFSKHHLILYEIVLTVQKQLIEILGQHHPPLDVLFDTMCRLLGQHLQAEGIIAKDIGDSELLAKAYSLCPHHVSHYLGLDIHDTSLMKRSEPVRSGMIVTVEPGIYTSPEDKSVPPEFRGVGIRIEDDVLITDGSPVNLTESAVKEVKDIEALVGKQDL